MGKNETKSGLKKLYIKAIMEQGDLEMQALGKPPRSYNEIQADLELNLWEQRFKGVHDIVPAVEEPEVEAAPMGMGGFEVEEPNQE